MFKRAEAIILAAKYKIKPLTCDLFLAALVANNYLNQPMSGFYKNLNKLHVLQSLQFAK
jgi:hypothetical protein